MNPKLGPALGAALHLAYSRRPTIPLARLNLSKCGLTGTSFNFVAESLVCATNLRTLSLDASRLDSAGMQALASLVLSDFLTSLSVSRTHLSERSVVHILAPAIERTRLRRIDLTRSHLREAGILALTRAVMRNTSLLEFDFVHASVPLTPFDPQSARASVDLPPLLRNAWITSVRVPAPLSFPSLEQQHPHQSQQPRQYVTKDATTVPLTVIDVTLKTNELRDAELAMAALAHGLHPRLGAHSPLRAAFDGNPLADPAVLTELLGYLFTPFPRDTAPGGPPVVWEGADQNRAGAM